MMETMDMENLTTKSMDKAARMMKSAAARLRRKEKKEVRQERLENFYAKMRRLRKRNVHD